MHPERRARTRRLQELGRSEQWEALYREVTLAEFPHEASMGWQLALLRTFAVPRMATLLTRTGVIAADPVKRIHDTGLIVYELVHGGPESARGRHVLRVTNKAHRGKGIDQEDMTYVLCAFIVIGYRYVEKTGWRPLTDVERVAAVQFWRRVGALLGIAHLPATYAQAETIVDSYEATYLGPSPEGAALGAEVIKVLRQRLPRAMRPITGLLFRVQSDNPRLPEALGMRRPSRAMRMIAAGVGRVYAAVQALRPPADRPFQPGRASVAYPHGYTIHDLGSSTRP